VLGVFAEANLEKASFLRPFYRTSAKRLNQLKLENKLKRLYSPVWPEQLGKIDEAKKAAGQLLFNKHCVKCHQIIPHGAQETKVNVVMVPIDKVGTDPRMATNVVAPEGGGDVLTGPLEGSWIPGFPKLPAKTSRGNLISNVGRGAILSLYRDVKVKDPDLARLGRRAERLGDLVNQHLTEEEIRAFLKELGMTQEKALQLLSRYEDKLKMYAQDLKSAADSLSQGESIASLSSNPNLEVDRPSVLAYKSRPLDGIWATAPYLHNGSVPNLYELLLPATDRSNKFHVGSRKFDPAKVGFETKESPGTTLLDTSFPGNSNAGHGDPATYGEFTEEERWQLVEYMKSL